MLTVTRDTPLTPERRLALSMLVLMIQDLNLENNFLGLKEFFILPKSRRAKKDDTAEAILYLFDTDEMYALSFNNCCMYMNLEPDHVRAAIIKVMDKEIPNYKLLVDNYNNKMARRRKAKK